MFRAPVHRGMRTLDRSAFHKIVPLKAARVFDNKNIFSVRSQLERSKDALQQERIGSVHADPDSERAKTGRKCILLRPEVVAATQEEAYEVVAELVKQQLIAVIPFKLRLGYSYWTYHDIITSILPEDEQGEIPSGFTQVGHVAHLNLRDEYLKYKHLIAEILMDKNPGVRTVINKVDDVGEENEYRTFRYEVLAGPDNMDVTISEENCTFRFDYSKVYWNSRLHTEHHRVVTTFKEGEAVCDVMAGVGPFAVPAGKKGIFVWANDLNPDSYASLQYAVTKNKVAEYVRPFNEDGRTFIKSAVAGLAKTDHTVSVFQKSSRDVPHTARRPARTIAQPKFFSHFVLNLPATALTFLHSFVGLYSQSVRQHLSVPQDEIPMPLVHVYCFSTKSDDNVKESAEICEEITRQLDHKMIPGTVRGPTALDKVEEGVEVFDVRDVAPKKRMFCATFRLPRSVAFREV
ncbi:hypothetical protein BAUCODRAFT_76373 [Baudoinia panamericana UAMH 10762]|uniref:tRNA (guanine(37)-N1)-methyltransferase n=1 Tax=Baudoinia panamericana (strain UAMH 10762) TaxID=717646 RepID=M2LHC6_BAUPA|nr:uncharacterized protein BAUCODRAFT_76373 [Baudoinia panamericana UAMH 10762]EMC93542.1 hypothetical protein BAUCODRAFT_76373 [Baudoinia panamericana UAMH 10762]